MVSGSMVLVSSYQMTLGKIVYMVKVEGITDHPPQNFIQFDVTQKISYDYFELFVDIL